MTCARKGWGGGKVGGGRGWGDVLLLEGEGGGMCCYSRERVGGCIVTRGRGDVLLLEMNWQQCGEKTTEGGTES